MVDNARPALIEPTHIRDTFVSGMVEVESVGTCARLTFFVEAKPTGMAELEHQVVEKLIMPAEAIPDLILQLAEFLAEELSGERIPVAPIKVLN
jgi:hypothetical protein